MIETKNARSDAANIETGMNTATGATNGGVHNDYNRLTGGLQGRLALRPSELAEVLGVGRNCAYQLCGMAGFPVVHIGRKIVVPVDGLRRWLDSQTEGWPDV